MNHIFSGIVYMLDKKIIKINENGQREALQSNGGDMHHS